MIAGFATEPFDATKFKDLLERAANWNQSEGGANSRIEGLAQAFGMAIPGRGGFGKPPFSAVMEGGKPKRVYHGTPAVYQDMDPAMAGKGAGGNLYGPSAGGYWTEAPEVAGGYSGVKHAAINAPLEQWEKDAAFWRQRAEGYTLASDKAGALETAHGYETLIKKALSSAPNIRPAYLDIVKPFDPDVMELPVKGIMQAAARTEEAWGSTGNATMTRLRQRAREWSFDTVPYETVAQWIGKDETTKLLQRLGYDGITHVGQSGARQWIPFRTDQIHSSFTPMKNLP